MIREQTRLKHKKYVHPVVHKKSCLVIIIGHIPGALKSIISLRSGAGLVIQATGRTKFEDGLRPGSHGGVLSDNPSVRTGSLVTHVL